MVPPIPNQTDSAKTQSQGTVPETAVGAAVAPMDHENVRQTVLQRLDQLPAFSPLLRRLLATVSMDDDEISLPKLADLVQRDTVISGKVLGIANSAVYNRGRE